MQGDNNDLVTGCDRRNKKLCKSKKLPFHST
jgi:hypothetical protein